MYLVAIKFVNILHPFISIIHSLEHFNLFPISSLFILNYTKKSYKGIHTGYQLVSDVAPKYVSFLMIHF